MAGSIPLPGLVLPPPPLPVENIGLNLCPVIALSLIPLRSAAMRSAASFKTAAEPTRRRLRAPRSSSTKAPDRAPRSAYIRAGTR